MGIRFPSFGTYSAHPQGQRSGGLGGEIRLSPKMSTPYELAYVSPLTEYSGEGSGGPSISKCVSSSRQSVMSEANYTLTGGGGGNPLPRFGGGGILPAPRVSAPYVLAYASPFTNHSENNCVAKNPGGEFPSD